MMNENLKSILHCIFFQLCGISEVNASDSLNNDLGLDSLALVTLMVMLEDEFHVQFLAADLDPYSLNTVQDVEDLVLRYIDGGGE